LVGRVGASVAALSERVRTDALASLARRVGASVAQAHPDPFSVSTRFLVERLRWFYFLVV